VTTPAVPEDAEPVRVDAEPEIVNGRFIDPVDPNQQELIQIRRETVEIHHGPLPAASQLREYEAVMDGLADRIVSMAEREQRHRHEVEKAEVNEPFRLARRGQCLHSSSWDWSWGSLVCSSCSATPAGLRLSPSLIWSAWSLCSSPVRRRPRSLAI
jgi:Predicted membrane protein (DUF2335)